jgi:hypothetical protein
MSKTYLDYAKERYGEDRILRLLKSVVTFEDVKKLRKIRLGQKSVWKGFNYLYRRY